MESSSELIKKERDQLTERRDELLRQHEELDRQIQGVDREFHAIEAYERAKTGKGAARGRGGRASVEPAFVSMCWRSSSGTPRGSSARIS